MKLVMPLDAIHAAHLSLVQKGVIGFLITNHQTI